MDDLDIILKNMEECHTTNDIENNHCKADIILIDLIKYLSINIEEHKQIKINNIIESFNSLQKWYA